MKINKLKLKNFRNYKNLEIEFNDNINIFVGYNGVGKTNILEAIYFASTSRSPRTSYIYDLINWDEREAFVQMQILGSLNEGMFEHTLARPSTKILMFEGVAKKLNEIVGLVPFVYFMPEDLQIIKGEAGFRRKLLDFVLVQLYPRYKYDLKDYRRVVLERNAMLKRIREGMSPSKHLDEWDESLAKIGFEIYDKRRELVNNLNEIFAGVSNDMFDGKGFSSLKYVHFLGKKDIDKELFLEHLRVTRDKDIRYGVTLSGPHRDDLVFLFDDINLRKFGSQGQQRSALLALKCSMAKYIKTELGEKPILLFDDVLSELDDNKRECLFKILDKDAQIFITTAEMSSIEKFSSNAKIFDVENLRD